MSLTLIIGGYYLKERGKAAELRAAMVRVHEVELAEAREAYLALRNELEDLIVGAAASEPKTLVDSRLHLPGLRSGNGLYLRLPLSEAGSKPAIAEAARWMEPDRIATCLGLAPPSARGPYRRGFSAAGVRTDEKQDSVLRLRLRTRALSPIRAACERPACCASTGSARPTAMRKPRDAPVRVFLWDLKGDELLLRARVKSQGVLLTSRILSQGVPTGPRPVDQEVTTGAANDCSIASQLKPLTASAPAK